MKSIAVLVLALLVMPTVVVLGGVPRSVSPDGGPAGDAAVAGPGTDPVAAVEGPLIMPEPVRVMEPVRQGRTGLQPVHLRRGTPADGMVYLGPGLYIVQFASGPSPPIAEMEAEGAVFHERIPRTAWVVGLTAEPDDDSIVRLFPLTAEMKQLARGTDVRVVPADPLEAVLDIAGLGLTSAIVGEYLRCEVTVDEAYAIAGLQSVLYVEDWPDNRPLSDVAHAIVEPVLLSEEYGFNGTGQIVAVADTGLDIGVINSSMHPDLVDRTIAIVDFTDYGPDDDTSHGTHVAGIIAGTGAASDGNITGIAPGAMIYFQAVADDSEAFVGVSPLYPVFQDAYDQGARIHSDSWGYDTNDYTTDSRAVDRFVNDNPDMVVVISAGNSGTDANDDGIVDRRSVISPGNSKNGITVGASESLRSEGGYANDTWHDDWPDDFGTNPIRDDKTSDDIEGMAAFSSRGMASDGRMKPDIVAPGTNIVAARSQASSEELWGVYDADYLYSGGTSMSAPVVSGAVAILREYLEWRTTYVPAALVKGILIATADDMAGQYGIGGAVDPIPNVHEGWGRMNLTRALDPERVLFVANGPSLTTGQTQEYRVANIGTDQLRFTLTWSDEPASALASVALINDLDLSIIAPDGREYKGNIFDDGHSVTGDLNADPDWDTDGDGFDDRNNVECVYFDSPDVGWYTIRINASDVATGQDFSLVLYGETGPDFAIEDISLGGTPVPGQPVNITVKVPNNGLPGMWNGTFDPTFRVNLTFEPADGAYLHNGSAALLVGDDGGAALVGTSVESLPGLTGDLRAVAVHPEGRYALIAGENGLFRWSSYSGVQKVSSADLNDVSFGPDGRATAVGDGVVVRYPGVKEVILDDPCDSSTGWTTGGTNDVWELGTPAADQAAPGSHSPPSVWGTDLDDDHPSDSNMTLRRDVDLTGYRNPVLSFWHYRDFEIDYDGGLVEVLGASDWEVVTPEGGYDNGVGALGRSGYSNLTGWKREMVFLDEYAGGLLSFRFRFASDAFVENPGWFIDDVRIVDWNASSESVAYDLTSVEHNGTGALAIGPETAYHVDAGTAGNATGLDPAGLWWEDGWHVVDADGGIYAYDGELSYLATTGNATDVEYWNGGWIAGDGGVHRYDGVLTQMSWGDADTILPDGHLLYASTVGSEVRDLVWTRDAPAVEVRANGDLIRSGTPTDGFLNITWTPMDPGIIRLTAEVNPSGPSRVPEANHTDNVMGIDIVVRPSGRYILVVDDDGGRDDEALVAGSIDARHVHNSTNGTLNASVMDEFDAVIWIVGEDFGDTLNDTERAAIGDYLDGGGRLFISGQDLGYTSLRDGWNAWYETYLHAELEDHDVEYQNVNGTGLYGGMSFDIDADRPGAVTPISGAVSGMRYVDGNSSAVLFSGAYRMVYWSIGVHQMNDTDDAMTAVNLTLDFLLDDTPAYLVSDGSPGNATTGDTYAIEVTVSDDTGVKDVDAIIDLGLGPMVTQLAPWDGSWVGNVTVPDDATSMTISYTFEDHSGNANSTAARNVSVIDDDPPTASVQTYNLVTGGNGTVTITASDNIWIADVRLVYGFLPDGGSGNVSANDTVDLSVPVNASGLNVTIFCIDTAGNWVMVPGGDLTVVDTLPPDGETDLTGGTYEPGKDVTLRARFTDNVGVVGGHAVVLLGDDRIDVNLTADGEDFIAVFHPGNHSGVINYTFVPEDAWGNSRSFGMHNVTPIDSIPPEILNITLGEAATDSEMDLSVEVSDNVGVAYVEAYAGFPGSVQFRNLTLDGGMWVGTFDVPANAATAVVTVNATDLAGNTNSSDVTADVNDTVSPQVQLSYGGARTGEAFNLTYRITDHREVTAAWLNYTLGGGGAYTVHLGSGAEVNDTVSIDIPLTVTGLTGTIEAVDAAGNRVNRSFDVPVEDTVRPIIDVTSPSTYSNGYYTLTFEVTDNHGVDSIKVVFKHRDLDGKENVTFTGTGPHSFEITEADGRIEFEIFAEDPSGNVATLKFDVREIGEDPEEKADLETTLLLVVGILGAVFVAGLLLTIRRRPVTFECPICSVSLKEGTEECPMCGAVIDWSDEE